MAVVYNCKQPIGLLLPTIPDNLSGFRTARGAHDGLPEVQIALQNRPSGMQVQANVKSVPRLPKGSFSAASRLD